MSTSFELLDATEKAERYSKKAVVMDQRKEYEQALVCYTKACEYLMNARKYNRNPAIRKKYGAKIKSWLERAEELKILIKNKEEENEKEKENEVKDSPPKIKLVIDPMREAEATIILANKKDKEREFSVALDLYMQGINYLMDALRTERNKKAKSIIGAKVQKYLKRAEHCKLMVKAHGKSNIAATDDEKKVLEEFRKAKEKTESDYKEAFPVALPRRWPEEKEQEDCLICYSDKATHGLTTTCAHFFCTECIKQSLEVISDTGQFPARCPMCRASDQNGESGFVDYRILAAMVNEGILTREFALRFKNNSQRAKLEQESEALVAATSKKCPYCDFPTTHYKNHGCHHIKPGTGCPSCGRHWCFNCRGPHPCRNGCKIFCSDDCACPICPDCMPGAACVLCDAGGCPACKIQLLSID